MQSCHASAHTRGKMSLNIRLESCWVPVLTIAGFLNLAFLFLPKRKMKSIPNSLRNKYIFESYIMVQLF
uniref:Uncharacterized protein n=1 Tax=Rhizophora mucronata TaxID=61149 RepID=A0A2P2NJK2_RHIMU